MRSVPAFANVAVFGKFASVGPAIVQAQSQSATLPAVAAHAAADAPLPPAPIVPPRQGKSETVRFDGKSLDGWDGNPEWWTPRDGGYTAKASGKVPTSFLLTKKNYTDFRLTLSSKMVESTNHAGVCMWGDRDPAPTNQWAYKCILVIFPNLGMWDYNTGKAIKLDPAAKEAAKALVSPNDWIQVEILAQGNRIRAAYNGVPVLDYREPEPARLKEGPVALQLHGFSQPQEVVYNDIVIESFPEEDRLLTVKK